jgi:hypothetical protein
MIAHSQRASVHLLRLVALSTVIACATDLTGFANKYTTAAERAFPRSYLQLLADAQLDSAFSLLAPEIRNDTARSAMRQVGPLLKNGRLDSMRLIGVNIGTLGSDSRNVNLTYEMPTTTGGWLVSNVATHYAEHRLSVTGFSAYPVKRQLEVLNRFTLSGKSLTHYVWLTLALLIPIGTIAVAVYVARSRGMPRRWLWVVLSLIAAPTMFINWTTGEVGVHSLSFLLFGGAATSPSDCCRSGHPGSAHHQVSTLAVPSNLRLKLSGCGGRQIGKGLS